MLPPNPHFCSNQLKTIDESFTSHQKFQNSIKFNLVNKIEKEEEKGKRFFAVVVIIFFPELLSVRGKIMSTFF